MMSSKSGAWGSGAGDVEQPDGLPAEVEVGARAGRKFAGIPAVRAWTAVLGGLVVVPTVAFWDQATFWTPSRVLKKPMHPTNPPVSRGQGRLDGFADNWLTSSSILCSNNLEYSIADVIVPSLYNLGFTPNGVVFLNVVVRGFVFHAFHRYRYFSLCLLLLVVQVLDAADGQLARAYSMTSKWGQWLDHVTDEIFTATFMLFTLYMMSKQCGWISRPVFAASTLFVCMVVVAAGYVHAVDAGLKYQESSWLATLGMYQMLYMSYIEILVVFVTVESGSVPRHAGAS